MKLAHAELFALPEATRSKYKQHQFKIVRIGEQSPAASEKIDEPTRTADYWHRYVETAESHDSNKEHLVSILLNAKHFPIGFNIVSIGSLNESIAHPREIFRPAIVAGAYALLLVHNHPSGDPTPSRADQSLTSRIREAATLLQMPLIDHVIIGGGSTPFFSFREAGLL